MAPEVVGRILPMQCVQVTLLSLQKMGQQLRCAAAQPVFHKYNGNSQEEYTKQEETHAQKS